MADNSLAKLLQTLPESAGRFLAAGIPSPEDYSASSNPLARSFEVEASRDQFMKRLHGASLAPEGLALGAVTAAPFALGPEVLPISLGLSGPLAGAATYSVLGYKERAQHEDEMRRAAKMWSQTGLPGRPERDLGHYEAMPRGAASLADLSGALKSLGFLGRGLGEGGAGQPEYQRPTTPDPRRAGAGRTGEW